MDAAPSWAVGMSRCLTYAAGRAELVRPVQDAVTSIVGICAGGAWQHAFLPSLSGGRVRDLQGMGPGEGGIGDGIPAEVGGIRIGRRAP